MISIIICSQKKAVLNQLLLNIEATIGVPYEIIAIDNPVGQIGICKAYNSGAEKAKYNILAFMHEDIVFHTSNWGSIVVHHLSDDETGLIGVAGSCIKNLVPSSWASTSLESEIHIIQHYKNLDKKATLIQKSRFDAHSTFRQEVVCLDGVWLCTKKSIFKKYQYDDRNFPGFHGYDIDFSMSINQSFKVYAIKDIAIEHFSEGSFNKQWLESAIQFSKKWEMKLPSSSILLTKEQWIKEHWTSMKEFIDMQFSLHVSIFKIWKYYFIYSFNKYFHFQHFLHFGKIILIKSIKELRK